MKGYFGRYLDVNLTEGKVSDYDIPEEWYEKFLGGRGIGARILFDELSPGVDPLGPENVMVFATGPLQGLNIAGAWQVGLRRDNYPRGVSRSQVPGFE